MKAYLSSYRFGNDADKLITLVGNNKKAAVIPNALDFSTDLERRAVSMSEQVEGLKRLGFEPTEIDLRDFFNTTQDLQNELQNYGLIWVRGGNTFVLRRAFQESGFDNWLIQQSKEQSNLVYAGYSAGICILSPSLRGLETCDDPNILPSGYKEQLIWEGLNLVPYYFAPHYKSDHPESVLVDQTVEYYIHNKMLFKALRDGDVLIENI